MLCATSVEISDRNRLLLMFERSESPLSITQMVLGCLLYDVTAQTRLSSLHDTQYADEVKASLIGAFKTFQPDSNRLAEASQIRRW